MTNAPTTSAGEIPPRDMTRSVLDAADIRRAISRISHEIIERTKGADDVVLLGIPRRGSDLAARIAASIASIAGLDEIPCGVLDVTHYRDDSAIRAVSTSAPTEIPECGIENKTVVLVDDVFFSGRTARAALTALDAIGRPASVQLAVLVDRGHREFPIRADYVGKNLPTARDESVVVHISEIDGQDAVFITSSAIPSLRRLSGSHSPDSADGQGSNVGVSA